MRRRKRKRQRKIIILSMISLLFILTVGYAAFQTNLNITAKGNIMEKGITPQELKNTHCNATSGDGLYKDNYDSGRCIYRGANPNNYITFNDEIWRIISIEKDNKLKIIKNGSIGEKAFDSANVRTTGYCALGTSPYLSSNYGCDAWQKINNHTNGNYSGVVDKDAELNIYLNNDYYNTIKEKDKAKIIENDFNIGDFGYYSGTYNDGVQKEKNQKWNGKIALLTASEYLIANSNLNNCDTPRSTIDNKTLCAENNWISHIPNIGRFRLITPTSVNVTATYVIYADKTFNDNAASAILDIMPVLYLLADINLTGKGTENSPYIIK